MKPWLPWVGGALFGAGVSVSGMVRPSKVAGFLDLGGSWDPSLALVMASGLALFALTWRFVAKRGLLFGARLAKPASPARVDARLVVGAAIFGVGWGLSGFCPGPAIVATLWMPPALLFVAAMVGGMFAHRLWDTEERARPEAERDARAVGDQ